MHAKMVVIGLAIDPQHKTPRVTLRESGSTRTLTVAVGVIEAGAVAFALEKIRGRRPSTLDLLSTALDALGGVVVQVILVDHGGDGGPVAKVMLRQGSRVQGIAAQVSDGIALALRCDVPIYCAEALLLEHAARRHVEMACPTHVQPPKVIGLPETDSCVPTTDAVHDLSDSMTQEDYGKDEA